MVRARLVPAAALALRSGGGVLARVRPRGRGGCRSPRAIAAPVHQRCSDLPRSSPRRPTRSALRRCAPSTSAWSRGGRPARARPEAIRTGGSGTTRGRGRRGPRRAARRPRADREARGTSRRAPHALHLEGPSTARGPRPVVLPSPRTSTCCRRSAVAGRRDPRTGRRPAARLVPRRGRADLVARRRPLGVGLALRVLGAEVAAGRPIDARAPQPGGRAHRDHAYVQFGDGSWRCFDLERGPHVAHRDDGPRHGAPPRPGDGRLAPGAPDRTYTSMLLTPERLGRWPQLVDADARAAGRGAS